METYEIWLEFNLGLCYIGYIKGATDRRLARLFSYKIAVTFGRGRLFLCLVTILTDRISDSKAGQTEA